MIVSAGWAAAIALAGSLLLSMGMTLQKRHVVWLGSPRPWGRAFFRHLGLWCLGILLMNLQTVSQYFALMGLPANVVGATTGASVAFTAMLAMLMLKERLGGRRLAWTLALFAAMAAAGFLGEGSGSEAKDLSPAALYVFLGIPLVLGVSLFSLRRHIKGPRLAASIAAVSGCLNGFMLFPLRALQVDAAPSLSGWLSSPYLYAYLVAGFSGFVLIQLAYRDGEMAAVAPALYGMQVIWPAIGSHLVFGTKFFPAQTAAFVAVAVCVGAISGPKPPGARRKPPIPPRMSS
jgi:drug/metabolite transporter (DMT)-like permease